MSGASRFNALPKHEQDIALRCLEWALSPAAAKVDLALAVKLRRASRAPAGATDDELLLMAYRLVVQGYEKHAKKRNAQGEPARASSSPAQGTATSTRATCSPSPPAPRASLARGTEAAAIAVLEEPLVHYAAQVLEAQLVAPEEDPHRTRRRRAPKGEGRSSARKRRGRARWR